MRLISENILLRKILVIAFWLLLWQLLSLAVDNAVLLVGPAETVLALGRNLADITFWQAVGVSFGRILAGILAGFAVGALLAWVSWRRSMIQELLAPVMTLLKATPVASFAVLLLIWWGPAGLSFTVCFLVVLPQIYVNVLNGLKSQDRELLEMAQVYRIPAWNRFFYICRPALWPFVVSGLQLAIGMGWKAGVAAELIGTPEYSIGERLYLSKVSLETAEVFAWTAVTILLCKVSERLLWTVLERFRRWEPRCRAPKCGETKCKEVHAEGVVCDCAGPLLRAKELSKSYSGRPVVEHLTRDYLPGETVYYTTPSGSGKTTLLRLLAGLERPDEGAVESAGRVVLMFQEDRLCMDYSAVKNVALALGDETKAAGALKRLLPEESLHQPVRELSGGMRRRVALVRAMETAADVVLLDEPFTGLDERNRERAADYVRERSCGRALLIAGHD